MNTNIYLDLDLLMNVINDILHSGLFWALLALVALDVILGTLRAYKDKKWNSSAGTNGLIKHTTVILLMLLISIVFRIAGQEPVAWTFKLFYIGQYATSVLANGRLLGAPMPDGLIQALEQEINAKLGHQIIDINVNEEKLVEERKGDNEKN